MIMTPILAAAAFFNSYRLMQGEDALASVLSQFGMVFYGLGNIVDARNKPLQYIFLALGGIGIIAGLIMAIISFRD